MYFSRLHAKKQAVAKENYFLRLHTPKSNPDALALGFFALKGLFKGYCTMYCETGVQNSTAPFYWKDV